MIQMKWANFPEKLREIVAKRALARMDTNIHNYHHMGRPIYRSKEMRKEDIRKDKATWFRASGATTTFTVPTTPGSGLARLLRSTLKGTGPIGTSVKILARPGPTIIQHLVKNNNSPRTSCGRNDCPLEECKESCS